MKRKILSIILVGFISFNFFNCSEVQDEITQAPILVGVHPDGFKKLGDENFHGLKLQATNWDLENCQKCHAADYSGGLAGVSCLGCHSNNNGPESCNTCHGVFADPSKIAPPNDVSGNSATTAKGVGAHSSHVYESDLSIGYSCFECHPSDVGSGDFVKAHIDGLPAEMSLSGYDSNALTCSNNYCHGSFTFSKNDVENGFEFIHISDAITGENFSPKWTQLDGTQAECGTCHLMPPKGHLLEGSDPNGETCASNNCHPSAYNEDGTLNKYAHANGKKDLN